jgi:hypothetical protein
MPRQVRVAPDDRSVKGSRADTLPSPEQAATIAALLAGGGDAADRSRHVAFAPTWRSREMAQHAAGMASLLVRGSRLGEVRASGDGEVRCTLEDGRGRGQELLLTFEAPSSGRIARLCVRPILPADVQVRAVRPDDIPAMTRLELASPVRRDDGTEVVIDHNGKQLEPAPVVSDHRWHAAFQDGRMVAVQGVALATAPIGGVMRRVAYNHYSRSDPQTRQSGNLIHLVMSLYRDIYPAIDQYLSIVDVRNPAGLRLSFGEPWPTRVQRLFLPVEALAGRRASAPPPRTFDGERAAALLNATHEGMNLWVPRTAAFLAQRQRRAPSVYGPTSWRLTDSAALALWPSGERRTYSKDGGQTVRTLALVLDYGFAGERGREELTGLLCRASSELVGHGISHIAVFVSDDHPPTRWLADLAEAADTYAVCAPVLSGQHGAPPTGPVYVDHILF